MMLAKIGPLRTVNFAGPLVVDLRSDQVGRQQVRGELDPLGLGLDGPPHGRHRQTFGQPGNALQ